MPPIIPTACSGDMLVHLASPIPPRKIILPHGSSPLSTLLKPNDLRPHVSAADHCLHWMTPFGLSHMHCLSLHLPRSLIAREQVVLARAVTPKTLSNYGAGLLHFTQYCDALDIPEHLWMPSPEWLLSNFITTRGAGAIAAGTLKTWLLGLELWHIINGAPWHAGPLLKCALQGSCLSAPISSICPKCAPVTLAHLAMLKQNLDLNNMFDAAVWATATVAFWCQCHLAEVCVNGSFDPLINACHSSPCNSGTTSSGITYSSFWAPSTKMQPAGEEIRWINSSCPCSAERAFKNHLKINSRVPPSNHLFSFETNTGGFEPMHRQWFTDRCNEIWSAVNLPTLSGHSFRVGGTTHLLLLGVDPFIVMAQGRWRSTAFLEYWRLCEEIIPTFISFSLQSQSSLLSTMSLFKQCLLTSM